MAVLDRVRSGEVSPEEALLKLKMMPFEDVGFAKIDHHRELRHGIGEVIYGEGKTVGQIARIVTSMAERGRDKIMITRLTPEKAAEIKKTHDIEYDSVSRIGLYRQKEDGRHSPEGESVHERVYSYRKESEQEHAPERECAESPSGFIVVAAAGTSDIPVAEEAAVTAETLGCRVERLYDVGVAGLHRLLNYLDVLMSARAIVAVAGMEGALATVIGGLVSCPVIAVPTSVGYGANFGGIAALLTMLNSCAGNVSVVNIDNGFSAGYIAALIGVRG